MDKRLDMLSNSPMPSIEPISSLLRLARMSFTPPKETSPCVSICVRASLVSRCALRIYSSSSVGRRFLQYSFPSGDAAYDSSFAIILSYSRVCNAFIFMFVLRSSVSKLRTKISIFILQHIIGSNQVHSNFLRFVNIVFINIW